MLEWKAIHVLKNEFLLVNIRVGRSVLVFVFVDNILIVCVWLGHMIYVVTSFQYSFVHNFARFHHSI